MIKCQLIINREGLLNSIDWYVSKKNYIIKVRLYFLTKRDKDQDFNSPTDGMLRTFGQGHKIKLNCSKA